MDSNWISPDTAREGLCCGATAPDRCVEFEVTLHPDATGIIFDIHSGAEPPGALFYQVSCNAPTPVGEALCLSGPGPHLITFCKPGSNGNEYSIQSIPPAEAGPPVSVHDGCSDTLFAKGFADSTVQWNSIAPGAKGAYNGVLSCDSTCDSTTITPQPGYPDTVLYEVCGNPIGGCDSMPMCDTVAVYYNPTLEVTIDPGDPIVCYGDSTAPIVASGSGGVQPYSFEWSTGDTGDSTQVPPGTYWVRISDTTDCPPAYDTAVVGEITSPIEANAGPDRKICVQELPVSLSGSLVDADSATWFGGNGTYYPSPDSLNISYDPTAGELANDSLELYLRTTNDNFCQPDTDTVVLNFIPTPLPVLSTTNVTCSDSGDGTARISLSGEAFSHSFSWNGGAFQQGDSTATGLSPGVHTVTIKDSIGCDTSLSFTITEPAPLQGAVIDSAPVSCEGGSDGWALAKASGGTTPYSYQWNTGPAQTGDSAIGLSSGSYVVEVSDSNGCTASDTVMIEEPPPLDVQIMGQKPVSCQGGANGLAFANVSGGVGGYSFSWNTSPVQNGDSATGLSAGSYIVEATDSNGCMDQDTVQISEPPPMNVDLIDKKDVDCAGDSNGFALAQASGGVGGYSYSWNSSPTQNGDSALGLSTGTYTVEAMDSNGCSAFDTVQISEPSPVSANIVAQMDASCEGASDGYAVGDASGGTGSYSFSWSTDPPQNSDTAFGLDSSNYTLTVQDSLGCMDSVQVGISDPSPIDVNFQSSDVSCYGGSDGSATAMVSGGTTPYSYSWNTSPTQSGSTATGLSAGTYTVSVTDAQGCVHTDSVPIGEAPELLLQTERRNVTCDGYGNGIGVALASGGTPPYSYSWSGSASNTDTLDSLSPGNYQVIVTDSLACMDSSSISITEPPPLQVSYNTQDAICNGVPSGSIQVTPSGGTPPYSYDWGASIGGLNGSLLDSLMPGTYQVSISDSLGCSETLSMTVQEPPPMNVTAWPSDTICPRDPTDLNASATGGNGGYSYLWFPGPMTGANPTVSPVNSSFYSVVATDSLGCTSPMDSLFVMVRNLKNDTLEAFAEKEGICIGDTATLSGQYGGEGFNVDFSWSPTGHTDLSPHTHVPDSNTQYVLTASNSCNDTLLDTVEVNVNPLPELQPEISTNSGCPPLKVAFEDQGGNGGATNYEWYFGDGTFSTDRAPVHTYRHSGTYEVSMKAVTEEGCSDSSEGFGEVFVHPEPRADFRPSPEETDMMDPEVKFEDLSTSAVEYFWNFGDMSTDTVASPVHTFQRSDQFLVKQVVWNTYGCADTAIEPILVEPKVSVYIPNAFTPDGDGKNDTFYPVMRGIKPGTFEMKIFDRWGEVIFESHHPDKHWKGDAKGSGELVKPDVYVYKVNVRDVFGKKHEYVGHVTVVR